MELYLSNVLNMKVKKQLSNMLFESSPLIKGQKSRSGKKDAFVQKIMDSAATNAVKKGGWKGH